MTDAPNYCQQTVFEMAALLANRHSDVLFAFANIITRNISNWLDEKFNHAVAYGPLKGFRFPGAPLWNPADRGCMLLGFYEKEVLESIVSFSGKRTHFIDLGAADGYYGVGLVKVGAYQTSVCYEIRPEGQVHIRDTARFNDVEDRVTIRGEAKKDFYKDFSEEELQKTVMLVDIEGGEFDLLDRAAFEALRSTVIFIEIHDFNLADGATRLKKLREDAASTHDITEIRGGARDPNSIPELQEVNDISRWLICSEARAKPMVWFCLTPKNTNA